MKTTAAIARLAGLALMTTLMPHAGAIDLDIAISVQERQADVAPYCPALRKAAAPARPLDRYRKGICLLYGMGGRPSPKAGEGWLRKAAVANHREAQMALADYLQMLGDDQQSEALQWYKLAQDAGDARAGGRYQHLNGRLAARTQARQPEDLPAAPDGTIVDPSPEEMKVLYGAGYHCHRIGLNQRWCHDSADGP